VAHATPGNSLEWAHQSALHGHHLASLPGAHDQQSMATAFTHGFVASLLTPFAPDDVPRASLICVLLLLSILYYRKSSKLPLLADCGDPAEHPE